MISANYSNVVMLHCIVIIHGLDRSSLSCKKWTINRILGQLKIELNG